MNVTLWLILCIARVILDLWECAVAVLFSGHKTHSSRLHSHMRAPTWIPPNIAEVSS